MDNHWHVVCRLELSSLCPSAVFTQVVSMVAVEEYNGVVYETEICGGLQDTCFRYSVTVAYSCI